MHSDCDSAESIADSDLEDGQLRQMLTSPVFFQGREENCESSRAPKASLKRRRAKQVHNVLKLITQEEREGLMSSAYQEPAVPGKPETRFFNFQTR